MRHQLPHLSIIAAIAHNGVIGHANALPWHLPADLLRFKQLTMGKPMIMGRRTFCSLPKVLPGRQHIVLTRDLDFQAPNSVLITNHLDDAIKLAGQVPEIMIIGGASVYAACLVRASRLYLTLIDAEIVGDVYFPMWNPDDWQEINQEQRPRDALNAFDMTFRTLERI
ncbi:dihydrofolate reductase [Thiospirillum jenense]|uniref:Dihydrofolate reductase n=1 Tax=Thiospirillum jenense TaxID=1653858 RepID=A0A839HQ25_9GAMM|nr:dihydrofolate reductase [Thiospirillum jenense]MBB1127242.1 dihydrofolate reductase [Thiospirillum jenense]